MRTRKAHVTVKDFKAHIESWCALRMVMHHQASSIESSRKDLSVFLQFCALKKVRRITGNVLVKFCVYLWKTRKNGSGAINRKRSTLRCFFEHLRLNQVKGADAFPIEHLPRSRQPYSGPINTLDPQEVITLFRSIDRTSVVGLRNFTLFFLLYALGLRLGEALALRLCDIDWGCGQLTINGKGRKVRTLPLTDKVSAMLKEWIFCRAALKDADSNEHLFLSRKGHRLSHRAAEEHFAAIVKAAGPFTLKRVTPHSLRHAFASHAIDNNGDILVVKSIMGHASLRSTELYLHPSRETQRKAVNNHLASDFLRDLRVAHHRGVLRINHRKAGSSG